MDIITQLGNEGLIPVVVIENADVAVDTARALLDGGLGVMEITMRTEAGINSIRNVLRAYPNMLVGAGTVLTLNKAKESVDAGARFIVAPGFNDEIVAWCVENNIPIIPGCVTPTEIEHALSYGLNVLKFFPANIYGGIEGMKALNGPFQMVSFIPTGGISEANLADYADKPFVHAIGGGFLTKPADIKKGNFENITKTATASINTLLGFKLAHLGINCQGSSESEQPGRALEKAFHFEFLPGSSSDFAGREFEMTKGTNLGVKGHIAIHTNSMKRAVYHLEKRGFSVDPATTIEKSGKMIAVYLKDSFGDFAIHLLQK